MITGTFNGWNVVAMPGTPQFSSMTWTMNDSVSARPSPWSHRAQILDWQIDWWDATIGLPQMTRAQVQPWLAFLAELRGASAAFLVGDPLQRRPSGLARGVPTVLGVNAARSTTLNMQGFQPNTVRQLLPGDQLQIGYRLHTVLNRVDSDGSGHAQATLWPRVREAPAAGSAIILSNPKGLFRLAENKRSVSAAVTKLYALGLSVTEAL